VCDWDKICEVKEPGDMLNEPEGEVEVTAEVEEDD